MPSRLYYAESFLTSFEAHVTDIRQISQKREQILWQIALDRTAFYPTSGGQPHDIGTLEASAPSGATLQAPILGVEEDEAGEVWHTTAKPLLAGTEIKGRIDWARRFDHMQQHSGQHLLSAVFQREAGASTVSFHLGEFNSTIDLSVDSLTREEMKHVEDVANGIIAEDRPVTLRIVERDEAQNLLQSGALRKLPERDGPIRLVDIADLDLNACGGTHVRATGQIGGLMIRGSERVKHGVRVEFACGLRAVRAAREDLEVLNRASFLVSAGHKDLPASIERLLKENKASDKERQTLREALAAHHATAMLADVPVAEGRKVVRCILPDQDSAYTKMVASRLVKSAKKICALLASTAQDPATVVIAASKDLDIDCAALLREAPASLGIRGGGTAEMAQGQIARAQVDALLEVLEKSLGTPT